MGFSCFIILKLQSILNISARLVGGILSPQMPLSFGTYFTGCLSITASSLRIWLVCSTVLSFCSTLFDNILRSDLLSNHHRLNGSLYYQIPNSFKYFMMTCIVILLHCVKLLKRTQPGLMALGCCLITWMTWMLMRDFHQTLALTMVCAENC